MPKKITYRCIPKCIDNFCTNEYMEICNIMEYYAEFRVHIYSIGYTLTKYHKNKRTHKDWNSFYELNLFIKNCNIPSKLYIQGVMIGSKNKLLPCPYPCQMIAREPVFIEHLKKIQSQCIPYNIIDVSQSIISSLVSDVFVYKKLSLTHTKINETELMLTYNYMFSDYVLLTIPDLCANIISNGEAFEGVMSTDRINKLKVLAEHYKLNQVDYIKLIEAKEKVLQYIDKTVSKYNFAGSEIYNLLHNIQQNYRG